MKQLFTSMAVGAAFFANAQVQTVALDNTFATNGIHSVASDNSDGYNVLPMIRLADGKIIFNYTDGTNGFLKKLSPTGSVDATFGSNGTTMLNGAGIMVDIKLSSAGNLMVLSALTKTLHQLSAATGQPVASFGTNGLQTLSVGNEGVFPQLVLMNGDVSLFPTYSGSDTHAPFNIYTHNAAGPFMNKGVMNIASDAYELSYLTRTPDNKVVASYYNGTTQDMVNVLKFDAAGVLDNSFASNGQYSMPMGAQGDNLVVKTDASGNVYMLNVDDASHPYIKKLLANGSVDTTFGTNGTFTFMIPAVIAAFTSMDIDSAGKIIAAGGVLNTSGSLRPFLARINANGTLDTTFNSTGYKLESTSADEIFVQVKLVNDSKILVGGETETATEIRQYLLTNTALATAEVQNQSSFALENPVGQALNFQSKEKVGKVEIYSAEGRLIRTVAASGASVADMPKGIYVAKVYFQNGKTTTAKVIKQ